MLDLSLLWPTGSSWVSPSITARYFSSCPSDSILRYSLDGHPALRSAASSGSSSALAVSSFRLCARLDFCLPSAFSGQRGITPACWIWRPSFERQRDSNPPEQRAAQHALRSSSPLAYALVLSASRGFRLCLFPCHRKPSSQVPYESPD